MVPLCCHKFAEINVMNLLAPTDVTLDGGNCGWDNPSLLQLEDDASDSVILWADGMADEHAEYMEIMDGRKILWTTQ